jgi:hypothetical protein
MRITLAVLAITLLAPVAVHAQRTSDYRDPDWTYEEGWVSLFNGKDLTGWVPVLSTGEDTHRRYREGEHGEQSTFFVKDGRLLTTGTPNGYVRTADVYDNFVFHVEIRYTQQGNTGVLIHVQQDRVWPKGIECQGYQSSARRWKAAK